MGRWIVFGINPFLSSVVICSLLISDVVSCPLKLRLATATQELNFSLFGFRDTANVFSFSPSSLVFVCTYLNVLIYSVILGRLHRHVSHLVFALLFNCIEIYTTQRDRQVHLTLNAKRMDVDTGLLACCIRAVRSMMTNVFFYTHLPLEELD